QKPAVVFQTGGSGCLLSAETLDPVRSESSGSPEGRPPLAETAGSPNILQAELNGAAGLCSRDAAIGGGRQGRHGVVEVHVIEHVEELGAKLERLLLQNAEVLQDCKVGGDGRRTGEDIAPGRAVASNPRQHKGIAVEEIHDHVGARTVAPLDFADLV